MTHKPPTASPIARALYLETVASDMAARVADIRRRLTDRKDWESKATEAQLTAAQTAHTEAVKTFEAARATIPAAEWDAALDTRGAAKREAMRAALALKAENPARHNRPVESRPAPVQYAQSSAARDLAARSERAAESGKLTRNAAESGARLDMLTARLTAATEAVMRRTMDAAKRRSGAVSDTEAAISEARAILSRCRREGAASGDLSSRLDRAVSALATCRAATPAPEVSRRNARAIVTPGARVSVTGATAAELNAHGATVRVRLGGRARTFTLTAPRSEVAAGHTETRDNRPARRALGSYRHALKVGAIVPAARGLYVTSDEGVWAVSATVKPGATAVLIRAGGAVTAFILTGNPADKSARAALTTVPALLPLIRASWGTESIPADYLASVAELVSAHDAARPAPESRRKLGAVRVSEAARIACAVHLLGARGARPQSARPESSAFLARDFIARAGEASTLNRGPAQVTNRIGNVKSRKV